MNRITTLALLGAAGLAGSTLALSLATTAAAQGSLNPQAKPSYTTLCPPGWEDRGSGRGGMCYPTSRARPAYAPPTQTEPCADGYGRTSYWCVEGQSRTPFTDGATSTLTKANPLDRCPIGYFTNPENGRVCISDVAGAPQARLRGASPCRTGEVEDWGIWCVSGYQRLSRGDAAQGIRDVNAIFLQSYYITGSQQGARQANLPEGTEYTPAYFTIFGRVNVHGVPLASAGAAATTQPTSHQTTSAQQTSTPAPAQASGRVGSMSPQRRTATALGLCPTYWVPGQPGSDLPDPNMCYPAPQATAIFPVGGVNDPCPEGYMNSVGWCMAATPAAQAAATQASAATTTTQPGVNCPPATNNQQAAQAGAALGGLLGGRRGNSQAGAAVGGLLGQAVGGAAQRPPGCP